MPTCSPLGSHAERCRGRWCAVRRDRAEVLTPPGRSAAIIGSASRSPSFLRLLPASLLILEGAPGGGRAARRYDPPDPSTLPGLFVSDGGVGMILTRFRGASSDTSSGLTRAGAGRPGEGPNNSLPIAGARLPSLLPQLVVVAGASPVLKVDPWPCARNWRRIVPGATASSSSPGPRHPEPTPGGAAAHDLPLAPDLGRRDKLLRRRAHRRTLVDFRLYHGYLQPGERLPRLKHSTASTAARERREAEF